MDHAELKEFLDFKAEQYNRPSFLEGDPVSVPHRYSLREDIEISGLLAAVIAWGNRKSIVKSAERMMELLGDSPFDFVMNHNESDLIELNGFVHRTFNGQDLICFIRSFRKLFTCYSSMEDIFLTHAYPGNLQPAIHAFRKVFFQDDLHHRSARHLSDPEKGSAAKRINMFLRWMVRRDKRGVDFGIWDKIPMSDLSCPLDLHSGNVARKLGLLKRKQNDAKAVVELDKSLRLLDPADPVKYDFALFGLGIFEKFANPVSQ